MNELWMVTTYTYGAHGPTAFTPIKVFSSAEKAEKFKSDNKLDDGYFYKVETIPCEL